MHLRNTLMKFSNCADTWLHFFVLTVSSADIVISTYFAEKCDVAGKKLPEDLKQGL